MKHIFLCLLGALTLTGCTPDYPDQNYYHDDSYYTGDRYRNERYDWRNDSYYRDRDYYDDDDDYRRRTRY